MPDIKLPIIPKPAAGTRAVFQGKAKPFIKGTGDINYLCGNCAEILLQGVRPDQVKNIVFRCPSCGSYNDLA